MMNPGDIIEVVTDSDSYEELDLSSAAHERKFRRAASFVAREGRKPVQTVREVQIDRER